MIDLTLESFRKMWLCPLNPLDCDDDRREMIALVGSVLCGQAFDLGQRTRTYVDELESIRGQRKIGQANQCLGALCELDTIARSLGLKP